jgi:hypothetical protein
MRFGKKHLRRRFGAADMETLARGLHRIYHNDPDAELGDLSDREVRDKDVVYNFLRYAYYVCDLAETDALHGMGSVYYR